MKKIAGLLIAITVLTSCSFLKLKKEPVIQPAGQLSWMGSVEIESPDDSIRLSLCNIEGIDYAPQTRTLYFISSNREGEGVARYFTSEVDLKKAEMPALKEMRMYEIVSQNNKPFIYRSEFLELLEKGRNPKYNVPVFTDIAYDSRNKHVIVLNRGNTLESPRGQHLVQPSLHTLSEGNRLMGQFTLNKLLKSEDSTSDNSFNPVEQLTLSPSGAKVFVSASRPLHMDRPGMDTYDTGFVRIGMYRADARSEEGQFLYPLNYPNDMSLIGKSEEEYDIAALLSVNDSVLWVLEKVNMSSGRYHYNLNEVVLEASKKITSKKPVSELKKAYYLEKKTVTALEKILPENYDIADMCWGPVYNKKQLLIFLVRNHCDGAVQPRLLYFYIN